MNEKNVLLLQKITRNKLRQDNMALKKNLCQLVQITKRNLEIQQKMNEVGKLLLECNNLEVMVKKVAEAVNSEFGLTSVTICLENRFRELAGADPKRQNIQAVGNRLFFMSRESLSAFFSEEILPVLAGELESGDVDFFGMKNYRRIRSQAIVPLYYSDEVLGTLNLGSNDGKRYRKNDSVDFLTRLGQMLSLAIVNLELRENMAKAAG